jgi:hypothetical protein
MAVLTPVILLLVPRAAAALQIVVVQLPDCEHDC